MRELANDEERACSFYIEETVLAHIFLVFLELQGGCGAWRLKGRRTYSLYIEETVLVYIFLVLPPLDLVFNFSVFKDCML